MSTVNNIVAAANVQAGLVEAFNGRTNMVSEGAPVVEVLKDPLNTNGFLQARMVPGNSKERIVELEYKQRLLESEASTSALPDCDGGDEPGDLSTTYNLDTDVGVSHTWTVRPRNLQAGMIANDLWVAQEIQRNMDMLARKMDTTCASKIVLNSGDFRDGDTSKTVATKNSAGGNVFDAIEEIDYQMKELEFYGTPLVLGHGETTRYYKAIAANCCADTGRNLAEYAAQNETVFVQARKIETAAGADNFIVMAPGAAQLVQFNEFDGPEGIMAVDGGNYFQGVLADPVTGIEYDYIAKLDCGVWTFQLKTAFDVFFMPTDMYRVEDPLYGSNYILQFAISNP